MNLNDPNPTLPKVSGPVREHELGPETPSSDDREMLMTLELYRREITAKDLGITPEDVDAYFRRQE